MLTLGACRAGSSGNTDGGSSSSVRPMRVVTDDLGRRVSVPVKVSRVVSLAPNLTENIFAVGAGDRLVGVTTFCNYPEAAKTIAKIGDTMNPNMESIVALKPDIVFVSTASQIEAFTKTLEANGIAVYVTNPTTLNGLYGSLEKLGTIFGNSESAANIIVDLQGRESEIRTKMNSWPGGGLPPGGRVLVFVQISKEPLFSIGKDSLLTQVVQLAGATVTTADIAEAYPKVSKESALVMNPEAIILSESPDNQEPNDVFKNSPAVKNGRVFRINADIISRPGPRLIDALEQIARNLHPEQFPG